MPAVPRVRRKEWILVEFKRDVYLLMTEYIVLSRVDQASLWKMMMTEVGSSSVTDIL